MFFSWKSFHFDDNSENIYSYVAHIRQVVTLFIYGEPQLLEVLKKTILVRLHWVLFAIEDLRQVAETAKKILTKEKIDR